MRKNYKKSATPNGVSLDNVSPLGYSYTITTTKGKLMKDTQSAIDALKLANQLLGDMFGIDESEDSE